MNHSLRVLNILFLVIPLCYCNANNSTAPLFVDGGRTIDSLKLQYLCQDIEFENWEEDDFSDSSLTVCFINSKIDPLKMKDSINWTLIASKIKNAVTKPERYKSYYIIFVKRETVNGLTSSSHTAGSDIPSDDL
ncbi:MAG TPA: hypothetical protein VGD22_17010 [Sphingobacteriaceae bacterium]